MRSDIMVRDPVGRNLVEVEVRARQGTDLAWAEQYRSNMLARGWRPAAGFFLLVTQDSAYLWEETGREMRPRPPDGRAEVGELLGKPAADYSGGDFELLLSGWLTLLISPREDDGPANAIQRMLGQFGILEALEGGRVDQEVA
jgi:hypothetical protein